MTRAVSPPAPSAAAPSDDAALDNRRLQRLTLDALKRTMPMGLLGNLTSVAVCVFVFLPHHPLAQVIVWAAFAELVNFARGWHWLVLQRNGYGDEARIRRHLRTFQVLITADGVTWALAAVLFLIGGDLTSTILLTAMLGGLAAGAQALVIADRYSAVTIPTLIVVPTSLMLILSGAQPMPLVGALGGILLLVLMRAALGHRAVLLESWKLAALLEHARATLEQEAETRAGRLRDRDAALLVAAGQKAAILQALPAKVALVNAQGNLVDVNLEWQEGDDTGLQLPTPEPEGPPLDLLARFDAMQAAGTSEAATVAAALRAILAGQGERWSGTELDLGARRYDVEIRALPEERGQGAVLMFSDSTARFLTRRRLAESEQELREIIDSTRDVLYRLDLRNGRHRWISPRMTDLLGHPSTLFTEGGLKAVRQIVHPDDLEAMDAFGRSLRDAPPGALPTFEYRLRDVSGTYHWFSDNVTIVVREDGRREAIGSARENTEFKRTAEALQQARKLEALGQLTGGVAHDFNNLLTVIIGSTESIAEDTDIRPDVRAAARLAVSAGQRAADLTRRLLVFARQQAMTAEAFDLAEMMPGLRTLLNRTLGENVEVELSGDGRLLPVNLDRAQFESSILNLAINARDAMPRGGTLRLEATRVDLDPDAAAELDVEPGAYAVLSVADTGEGMPAEVIERALEPFFTTKEVGKGTGLGLSMVYGFVRECGGWLTLASTPGTGTCVRLGVPLSAAAAAAPVPAPALRTGSGTVLVVEDNDLLRDLVARSLESLGYEGVMTGDAPAALVVLQSDRPLDLLFTDLILGGDMNGAELAVAARNLRPGLAVLLTTGREPGDLPADAIDRFVCLRKPYRRAELSQAIADACARDAVGATP